MEINRTDKPKRRPLLTLFFLFSTTVYLLLIYLILGNPIDFVFYHEVLYDYISVELTIFVVCLAISFHTNIMALTMFIWNKSKNVIYTQDPLRKALKIYVFFGVFCSIIGSFPGMLEEDAFFFLFVLASICNWGALRLIDNCINIYYLCNDVPIPEKKKKEKNVTHVAQKRFSSYSGFGGYSGGYSSFLDDDDDDFIPYEESRRSSNSRSSWSLMPDSYYGRHGEFDTNDRIRANMEDMQQMSHDRGFDPFDHGYDWDEISDASNDGFI